MTVVLAHPSPSVADGMATAVAQRVEVPVHATSTWRECRRLVAETGAGVVVVDSDLVPGLAQAVCAELVARGVRPLVLVRSGATSHLSLLESGAAGIVVDTDGLAGLLDAVRTGLAGDVHVPPHLLGALLHELIDERRRRDRPEQRLECLSPRERQVLALLGRGADTREIAARLVISPHTAKTHINRVLGKLGLASRTEAATFASALGRHPELLEVGHE